MTLIDHDSAKKSGRARPELSSTVFEFFRDKIYELAGITMTGQKQQMVQGRLARRLRPLGLSSFEEYAQLIRSGDKAEVREFINALTTNVTSFFRESPHFDYLGEHALKELMELRKMERKLRIWCSASSTGQEPYSIAMVVRESIPPESTWDVKILATDLDTDVLQTAHAGSYPIEKLEGISEARKKRFFDMNRSAGSAVAKPSLKKLITFKRVNLLKDWPMKGQFDIIFCRNVVIYFDKETQKKLFSRMAKLLRPGGYLFIGHSESLIGISEGFDPVQASLYRRVAE